MFAPKPFYSNDLSDAKKLINKVTMGTIISHAGQTLSGSPLPFLASCSKDKLKLFGHMDKRNALWQSFSESPEVIIVFWGPNSYVSPAFYQSSPRVPTWMFSTCHIYGTCKIIEDPQELDRAMVNFTSSVEPKTTGWTIAQVENYKNKLLSSIVGFDVDVEKVDCQLRHGQQYSQQDNESVMAHLRQGDYAARQLAEWIQNW